MGLMEGKVAIVTGSTQGIGRGVAMRFAKEGAKIVVCSRRAEKGAEVLEELSAITPDVRYVRADVGVKADLEALVAQSVAAFGRVDVLVNNAQTIPAWEKVELKPDSDHAEAFTTGYYATLWAMQAVFPHMRDQGGGRIINMGSNFSTFGARYSSDYNSAKEAIRGLTRTAANEWGQHNILVNVILPVAESEGTRAFERQFPERFRKARARVPLQWHGDPERDIGGVCVALAIEDGRFITGETIFVDGGMVTTKPAQTWMPSVRYEKVKT